MMGILDLPGDNRPPMNGKTLRLYQPFILRWAGELRVSEHQIATAISRFYDGVPFHSIEAELDLSPAVIMKLYRLPWQHAVMAPDAEYR